ncbi:hypothetical protein ACFY2K_42640 [Kitasatospora sp. NPDC001309]|uniref:hypothetical protein n=1 Tax=Kitasatospora sp. NPDC001309 TaxID=3364013 RepID=UPI0036CA505F
MMHRLLLLAIGAVATSLGLTAGRAVEQLLGDPGDLELLASLAATVSVGAAAYLVICWAVGHLLDGQTP